ncbi:MAG: hemerythrin domain-containing protein [Deltaproteobacteria bacterium]|nr:hemerythrin domain-containing protein [Deltaproteobacteria bacterium]
MQLNEALSLLVTQHDEIETLLVDISAATSPAIRTQALSELADKLTLHLAIEQEILYPAADPLISGDVRAEVAAEHQEIKRVLADLIWLEHEDQRFARKLVSLQNLLQWHEAWQEAELFERVARGLPAPRLEALGHEVSGWLDRSQFAFAA